MKMANKNVIFASLMSVVLFMGTSSFVHSEETVVLDEAQEVQEVQETEEISGKIVSVDAVESTVVIEYVDATEQVLEIGEFQLNEASEITLDGAEISLAELKAGDEVSAAYIESETGDKIIDILKIKKS